MKKESALIRQLDLPAIRADFPLLKEQMNEYPLVYLDNAATTQKPQSVIDAMAHYYAHDNANVHRGLYALGMRATEQYEAARAKIQRFIHAPSVRECIYVRGTTEAINLVAQSFVAPRILPGEEILITHMEHHSNIVPWQMVCKKTGALLKVAPINLDGEVLLDEFEKLLNENTKFVSISYASNALGTINPVKKMIEMAHAYGALVMLDAAQATPHLSVDVQDLDCDFLAFSGHKMYGPTGIGVLWGREALLDDMVPYQGGGEMINSVTFAATEYAPLPQKFEAGTPNIAGAMGLSATMDYLWSLDMDAIRAYENFLLDYATEALRSIKGYNIIGTAQNKVPILSFVHGKIHSHDIGTILDSEGIAVRSGHHCAMPLMDFYEVAATTRISLAFYNTVEEIDACMQALQRVKEVFAMNPDLRELYQEVILDHNKNPRNQHAMDDATAKAQGFNPLCGDKMTVYLKLKDGVVKDISFLGCGCAISQASASLMTEIIKDKSVQEAHELFNRFHAMVTKDQSTEPAIDKLTVLAGVKTFPARVKCATLAWHTLEAALNRDAASVSTE